MPMVAIQVFGAHRARGGFSRATPSSLQQAHARRLPSVSGARMIPRKAPPTSSFPPPWASQPTLRLNLTLGSCAFLPSPRKKIRLSTLPPMVVELLQRGEGQPTSCSVETINPSQPPGLNCRLLGGPKRFLMPQKGNQADFALGFLT